MLTDSNFDFVLTDSNFDFALTDSTMIQWMPISLQFHSVFIHFSSVFIWVFTPPMLLANAVHLKA